MIRRFRKSRLCLLLLLSTLSIQNDFFFRIHLLHTAHATTRIPKAFSFGSYDFVSAVEQKEGSYSATDCVQLSEDGDLSFPNLRINHVQETFEDVRDQNMFHHGYKAVTFEDMKTKLDGSSMLSREAFFPLRFSASKGLKRSPSTCEENPEYPRSSLVRDQDAFLRFVWEDQDNGCLGIKQHLIKQLPKCWPKKNALQPRLCWGLDTESDCETKKDDFEKFTCQWNPVAHLELLLVESDEADLNNMSDDFVQELSYGLFSKSVRKECQKYFNLIKPLSYFHRGEYMGNAEILAASRSINDEATLEKPAMTIEQGVLQQTAEPASPPSRVPITNGCERFPTKEDRKGQYANMKEAYPWIHVDTQLPPMDDWIRYLEQHRPKYVFRYVFPLS